MLLIRRGDVLSRFRDSGGDLSLLSGGHGAHPDPRWDHLNVLGQVANVLREEAARREAIRLSGGGGGGSSSSAGAGGPFHRGLSGGGGGGGPATHVVIPAEYRAGITLVMRRTNPHLEELMSCPELPLVLMPTQEEEEEAGAGSLQRR